MNEGMAIRAKVLKVRTLIVGAIQILMVNVQYFWMFVVAASRALLNSARFSELLALHRVSLSSLLVGGIATLRRAELCPALTLERGLIECSANSACRIGENRGELFPFASPRAKSGFISGSNSFRRFAFVIFAALFALKRHANPRQRATFALLPSVFYGTRLRAVCSTDGLMPLSKLLLASDTFGIVPASDWFCAFVIGMAATPRCVAAFRRTVFPIDVVSGEL
jgi:hypothetical protein